MPVGDINQSVTLINLSAIVDSNLSYYFASTLPTYAINVNSGGHISSSDTGPTYLIQSADFVDIETIAEDATSKALTDFANVANLSFNYLNSASADIVISGLNIPLYAGPSELIGGITAQPIGSGSIDSDVFIMPVGASSANIYRSMIHELMHSVGLLDGIDVPLADNPYLSVMSYKGHPLTGDQVHDLQLYDIASLQAAFGRNDSFNAGDTTIDNFSELISAYVGNDRVFSIWDAGGIDTIDASGLATAAFIDLRPGYFSAIGNSNTVAVVGGATPSMPSSGIKNVSIAYGAYIENATGTSNNDLIVGNMLGNNLFGGDGDDVLYGEGADSIYDAGDGDYTRITQGGKQASSAPVAMMVKNAGLQRDSLSGEGGSDALYGGRGKDTLSGGTGSDYLRGGSGNDTLSGDEDDDFFYGEEGDDEIWGGAIGDDLGSADGEDIVDYSSGANPITITFNGTSESANVIVMDGLGGTDTLASIEKIIGTTGYDSVQINGEIPLDTQLTIDANGGQSPNAYGSILNGKASTKEIRISIDATGNGYIRSVGGGEITLEGFHTQAIATAFDDEIADASNGKKRLDGGAGNDIISTAGSTGNATIYGGDGEDTLTGGDGNDVIYGDQWTNWEYNENVMDGGAGSDFIVSSSAYDIINGGSGNDYIKLNFASGSYDHAYSSAMSVDGGEDDDFIEIAGYVSVDVVLAAGSGHDTVTTPAPTFTFGSLGTNLNIVMDGLDDNDFTIVVDATPTGGSYYGFADIAVVINATGDSIFLPNQYVHANDHGASTAFSIISFNGSQLKPGHHVVFGSTSAYATDLSGFNSATAPDVGNTTGTSGNDHLAGGTGDDNLSGGGGNDIFETSGGNDSIDGGAGEDTLNLFGARAQFTISGSAGSMTLTDNIGREGEITVTGVERLFFVGDGEFYNLGDFFGYAGTAGADVITASNRDNDIQGFGGNDTINALGGNDVIEGGEGDDLIDGGGGNDIANYSGSSTDYIVTRLSGGGATIETTGVGINDGTDTLQGVESIYFAGDDVTLDLNTLPLGGTSGDDILIGGDGDDVIDGGDGDDLLQGGAGYDVLNGGAGNDTVYYAGKSTDYSIYLWTDGGVYVDDYSESGADGSDELVDIEALYFAGDGTTLLVPDDLPPLGTSGNDVISGTNRHDTLVGLEGDDVLTDNVGNDYLDGGAGADTMTGGEGDDSYIVDDVSDVLVENADEGYDSVSSSISYTLGVNVEELSLWSDVSAIDGTGNALDNTISGDNFGNTLLGLDGDDFLRGGDGDDTIDGGNGTDTADFFGLSTDFEAFREIDGSVTVVDIVGSQGEDTLFNVEYLNFSYGENVVVDVADLPLRGTASNDALNGGAGNDTLFGLGGNDRLTGGAGNDVLDGGTGTSDAAVFAGTQASHTIATNGGVVSITDNQPSTDGNDGTDTVIGIEIAEFKGGVQVGVSSPIVLDLNGDGVSLVNNRDTNVAFDWDRDGRRNQTGWIGRDDGFLVFDRDGDGLVSNGSELSFTNDKPGAKSDLDGLRAFDSNGDGQFSSDDEKFGEFHIWRDANANGRSEAGEISTLNDAGVASINLTGQAVNQIWAWGDNITINNGSYTRADGSSAAFGDIALNYDVGQAPNEPSAVLRKVALHRIGANGRSLRDRQIEWQYERDPISHWPKMGDDGIWSDSAVVAKQDLAPVREPQTSAGGASSLDINRQLALLVQEMSTFGVKSASDGLTHWQHENVRPVDFFA